MNYTIIDATPSEACYEMDVAGEKFRDDVMHRTPIRLDSEPALCHKCCSSNGDCNNEEVMDDYGECKNIDKPSKSSKKKCSVTSDDCKHEETCIPVYDSSTNYYCTCANAKKNCVCNDTGTGVCTGTYDEDQWDFSKDDCKLSGCSETSDGRCDCSVLTKDQCKKCAANAGCEFVPDKHVGDCIQQKSSKSEKNICNSNCECQSKYSATHMGMCYECKDSWLTGNKCCYDF